MKSHLAAVAMIIAMAATGLVAAMPALAQSPSPSATSEPAAPTSGITITAQPMLGGRVRPGSWAAIRVLVENHGPTVNGELRISTSSSGQTTYGFPVQLASSARQEHLLYGQTAPLSGRFTISLVSGDAEVARLATQVDTLDSRSLGLYLVAERPEPLVAPVRDAVAAAATREPEVMSISPQDLPPRIEAWSAADLIVWHDADATRLTAQQIDSLRTWIAMGGHLVVVIGSSGTARLGSLPQDLLPYQPTAVVDVPVADLEAMLGDLPDTATPLPAHTGALERGQALATSGSSVIAARASHGLGSVSLLGLDAAASWLADPLTATAFWTRVLPPVKSADNPLVQGDSTIITSALNNIPSVQLPRLDFLFLLIVAYILAIGPITYFILRRRDRREWAWVTMPVTIGVFAILAYVLGTGFRGSSVVVNELAVVHGSAGADRGVAEVHVGIYSPGRATFNVSVGGGALLSAPRILDFRGPGGGSTGEAALDVIQGDPSQVRNYGVGFGTLRSFRAQAQVATPRIDADLHIVESDLQGTITNASSQPLEDVVIVYADSFERVGTLAPSESRAVDLAPNVNRGQPLAERLFPMDFAADPGRLRIQASRRAVIEHLGGGWNDQFFGSGATAEFPTGPVILAWHSGPTLDVDLGTTADAVGERLYLLTARANLTGPTSFAGQLLRHSTIDSDAVEFFEENDTFFLGRGTLATEYRPVGFDGSFRVTALTIRLGIDLVRAPGAPIGELQPLPADEQPDSDAPLASNPRPGDGPGGLPRVQLFDLTTGLWVEFEPVTLDDALGIPDPARYVDESGTFRVRFVVRDFNDYTNFTFNPRLDGTVE